MKYRVVPSLTWLELPDRFGLLTPRTALQLDSETGTHLLPLIEALRVPRSRDELASFCDEDSVDDLLAALDDWGVLERIEAAWQPRSALLSAALEGGCAVLARTAGPSAELADAVLAALLGVGVAAERVSDAAAALADKRLVIGCFASLFDAEVTRYNQLALGGQALYLPLVVERSEALIGPLLEVDGPCARCVALRVLAQPRAATASFFHAAWYEAQEGGAIAGSALEPRHLRTIADHMLGFLGGLDADNRLEGRAHALLRLRLDNGIADVRRVLRHSHCRACGLRPPSLSSVDTAVLSQQRARTIEHWQRILEDDPEVLAPEPAIEEMYRDPVTGILQHGEEWTHRDGYFRNLPECWGGLSLVREEEWVSTEKQGVNGTGPDLAHMRLVMLSEGLERYAQYSHRAALTGVPYRDIEGLAFDPRHLTLYDEEQYAHPDFPRQRFREDLPLNWTWGYSLSSGDARLFPQEVVTVQCTDEVYPTRLLDQRLTTGGASHVCYARALQNAMRELVERDQLMIAWYKRVALPRLEIPQRTGNDYVDGLLAFLRERGVQLDLFDLRLDLPVPCFLVLGTVDVLQGDFHPGGTVGAAAADLDPLVALGRALGEMRIHYETLALTPDAMKDYRQNPYDPHDMKQGWGLWWPNYMWALNPANRRAFDFLYQSPLKGTLDAVDSLERGDPKQNRSVLVKCLERVGLEPWAWDIGNHETSISGFRIVKVEVPGLCHLVPGRQSRRLACERFERVPLDLGRPCLPPGEQNPDPHIQA